jgi:hypothetical protein
MKKLVYLIIIPGIVWALISLNACTPSRTLCNSLYPPVQDTSTQQVLIVNNRVRIDTILVPPDTSAFIRAIFECDSIGNAMISQLQQQTGNRSVIQVNTGQQNKRQINATFRCRCDSLAIYHVLQSRDTIDRRVSHITKTILQPVPAENTWWQKFKIEYGGYAMAAILAYLILRIGWWALRTYTRIQLPFLS